MNNNDQIFCSQKKMQQWMKIALHESRKSLKKDYVPVGCVLTLNDKLIIKTHNGIAPFEHAELLAIQFGYIQLGEKIRDATIYITLEPCDMCASMIALCHISRVVFGAYDTKNGGIDHGIQKKIPYVIGGIMEEECSEVLKNYFKAKR